MTDQLRFDGREQLRLNGGPSTSVECLGLVFESEGARRDHFLAILADRIKDPAFRNQAGFPAGTDDDILKMSDPPYYTACPNPFLGDFVRVYGKPYDSEEPYHRDPFAVDVSVGKTHAIYKAHSYHTKVPHLAIVPSILHYTQPGDIVLDGFCGSGMTGVAAQFCGSASAEYRMELESEWHALGLELPKWGARRPIVGDLSPAATFIAAGYNVPPDVSKFEHEALRVLDEVESELGWAYQTVHTDGHTKGRINYTVWSEVFSCPDCGEEIVYLSSALDLASKQVMEEFPCHRCGALLTRKAMSLSYRVASDPAGGTNEEPIRVPMLINYSVGGQVFEKQPDEGDLEVLERLERATLPASVPTSTLPYMHMTHERARMDLAGVRRTHHFYSRRQAAVLGLIWSKTQAISDAEMRRALLFVFEQAVWTGSLLNRYRPKGFSQTGQYMTGVYYVPAQHSEVDTISVLRAKVRRVAKAFSELAVGGTAMVTTGDCANLGIPAESVDYVFTDPPFGENIYYSDLNYLVESWHKVQTQAEPEAIIDRARSKSVHAYQDLMTECFRSYYRALKPGRWMTVVFSNSSNGIWRAIQEAMSSVGFVVADTRTLDKQMGSYRQVTSSAVKQDLVISAYKPNSVSTETTALGTGGSTAAWAFVAEHLQNVPVVLGASAALEIVVERTPQMLHDRMVGFFVQRGLAVPLSTAEFMVGLSQRYPERDGMYFVPEQVAQYDKRRAKVDSVQQLSLMVIDESSAIQWVRQLLDVRPQSFPELAPLFMREAQHTWAKHEEQIELKELLEENFLMYDGKGPVPSQVKSYLSSNWREYRSLGAEDPSLQAKAKDRWYVPEPGKFADLSKLRERQLLKEFEQYRVSTSRKIKIFRTEAVRAGFKRAYDERDWDTIVSVAGRLPDSVVQEDEKLLMYYDVARMRVG